MELDLPMFKEAYKNIAIGIKELETPDNKEEIKKLEELIERNQAQIRAWKTEYDPTVWPSEEVFREHDNARFEEYAEPFNANIREAEKMIKDLENGMEENQLELAENKAKQLQLKKHADKARENAEVEYQKARKELVEEWEKSEDKKKYDSNLETIDIISLRIPNLMKAEQEALIRLKSENAKLKQILGNKLKSLEEEYAEFLQELDKIDKEYGIDTLEGSKETETKEISEEETEPDIPVPGDSAQEEVSDIPVPRNNQRTGNTSREKTGEVVTEETIIEGRTAPKELEIFKMQLDISKDGTQLMVQKREKGKFSPQDPEKGKLNKLAKEIGTQDEIIKTEIQKAVEDGILTVDEAKKELDLYEELTQTDDEKEKETIKDKMKLKLNYDLSGMRKAKLSPDIRRQMRANAAECLKLGIGDVTPTWMKIVVRAEDWYKKSWLGKSVKGLGQKVAGLLTAAKGEGNQPETVEKPKIGTVVARKGKTDRLGYRVEKTPDEIEAEATARKVGEVVEEIQNENKGVEPDQD